jgi:hypothetical protein
MKNNIKIVDDHDEKMTPALREELRMHSIIASLDELTPEERDEQIRRSKRIINSYRSLIAQDPQLSKIL